MQFLLVPSVFVEMSGSVKANGCGGRRFATKWEEREERMMGICD